MCSAHAPGRPSSGGSFGPGLLVLVLIASSFGAFATHPSASFGSHSVASPPWPSAQTNPPAARGAGVSLRTPFGAVPTTPQVADTLVLLNSTVVPGNFLAENGMRPIGIAYDSGKAEAFVADSDSSTVRVINISVETVVATIVVGDEPNGVAYDPTTGQVFVANGYAGNVSVIDDS